MGEAGIGKTQLARTFAAHAIERGARVLWGTCFEGDWVPRYGPWIEALDALAQDGSLVRLEPTLAGLVPVLAHVVPGVVPREIGSSAGRSLEPADERLRMFHAVGQLLLALSVERPVLLVLDDLHWADSDSLQLLRYVARVLHGGRLLILGVCREPGGTVVDPQPLAEVLAIIRRESHYDRINVTGLAEAEMAQLIGELAGRDLPQALLRAINAVAEGNPFYAREIFRHLVEEGVILLRDGRWSTDVSPSDLGIPDEVRQVVLRRTARLSTETVRLLTVAAALTGGFEVRLLAPLLGLSDDALLDCLDEAMRAGLLRVAGNAPPRYDFAHAIVRHALYAELNPDRRARLHRQIARALEETYRGQAQEHASELAYQYHASVALGDGEPGVAHCLRAAEESRAGLAFDRAVTYLRMARALAQDGHTRASVLQRLATAEAEALLLADARRTADAALIALSEAGVSKAVQARFLEEVGRALKEGGAETSLWQPLVEQGLARLGSTQDRTWARLTLLIDHYETDTRDGLPIDRWQGYDPEAVAILRASGDEVDFARTLEPRLWHTRDETAVVRERARTWTSPSARLRALGVAANDLLTRHGAFCEAAECLTDLLTLAENWGSIAAQVEALVQLVVVHADLGSFDQTRAAATRARLLLARLGIGHRLQSWLPWMSFNLAIYLDCDWDAVANDMTVGNLDVGPRGTALALLTGAAVAVAHSRLGHLSAVDVHLDPLVTAFARLEPRTYAYSAALALTVDAAWLAEQPRLAGDLRRLSIGALEAGLGDPPFGAHALSVARMSALLGDGDGAQTSFAQARAAIAASGRRPLAAIADLDEARFLSESAQPEAARARLLAQAAASEFDRLGMTGWARRARELRDQLDGAVRSRSSAAGNASLLTPREVEVLRLIAEGHPTRDIAAHLVVSAATVERHISNIYGKIGARGRADATSYAWQHGVVGKPDRPPRR